MASMLSFIKIVCAHDGPRLAFLNCSLESGQIDFIKSTVVHNNIGGVTVDFLIIQRIVLYTGSYTILLHTLYIRNHHAGSQIRIFTHILKVTSIQRSTVNVDTGTQKDILVAITRLFTDTFSIKQRHIRVPCSSQTSQCRISHTRVIGPASLIPLIPKHFGTNTMRTIRHPVFRNT